MKLLVILLCLFSERFLIHAVSYQRFNWFGEYYLRIKKITEHYSIFTNPWVLLIFIILPLSATMGLIYGLLHGLLYGFIGLLLSIVIVYYSLGPQNIFYPITQSESLTNNQLVGNYFFAVNRQFFAMVFWYIILGPIAAFTYRLVVLCREINLVAVQANEVTDLLEWIPTRLTGLLFLLVGNFQRSFTLFASYILAKPDLNSQILSECGLEAARTTSSEEVGFPTAQSLVEHAIIVMLVFIALFTLISCL